MLVRPPALDTVQAISLVSLSQICFYQMPFKKRLVRKWVERICLKQICEEVDGRTRWTEEALLMDDSGT
jgi:hypothetical protein